MVDFSELGPHLQDVFDRFIDTYAEGGIAACRALVEELDTERKLLGDFDDSVQTVNNDDTPTLNELELKPEDAEKATRTREMTEGVTKDVITATSRHSFAYSLLNYFEKHIEPKSH